MSGLLKILASRYVILSVFLRLTGQGDIRQIFNVIGGRTFGCLFNRNAEFVQRNAQFS